MQNRTRIQQLITMDNVWDFYRDDLQRVEERIQKSLDSPVNLINQVALYILSSGGKRIRPLLLLISSKLDGQDPDREAEVLLASAVEFIHTATLLHDDVIDQAEVRRGKKSAHTVWGNQASILVGDFLYTQAVSDALKLANQDINTALAEACRLMTEGETLQLAYHGNPEVTEQEYLNIIRRKTGALLSATCRLGGILSGLDPDQQNALAQFGLYLGIAYQLTDDILDYTAEESLLGKSLGKDLSEGKITLPLVHLFSHCSKKEQEEVRSIINSDSIASGNLQDILTLMKQYGSLEYSLQKAKEAIDRAKHNLDFSPHSIHRQALFVVADYAVSRDH